MLDELEELLIISDISPAIAQEIILKLTKQKFKKYRY